MYNESMPLHAAPAYLPIWRELLNGGGFDNAHVVVDQPTGYALWDLEPLPRPALIVTFNAYPLYLLDLYERSPEGLLVSPDSSKTVRAATDLIARGQRVGSPPEPGCDLPTRRERQVLRQLARGRCAGEIARSLGVKRETVYTYLQNLREKLGVDSQHELALTYLGMVHPGGI